MIINKKNCTSCSSKKNMKKIVSGSNVFVVVSGWLAVSGGTSKERGLNSVHINFTTQVPIVYDQLVPIL